MKRRDFLKISTATGLMSVGGVRLTQAQSNFSGPYWLLVEARGGWDPTSFCDPKGRGLGPNGDINNYDQDDIDTVGNFAYAPPPDTFVGNSDLFSNQEFFTNHFQRLVVVNGIDMGTNSHQIGRTAAWTGTRAGSHPSIGAMIAGTVAPEFALPYVTNSSSESGATKGLVPTNTVSGGSLNVIREVAFPNRSNVFNTSAARQYFADGVYSQVNAASAARRQRQIATQRLARIRGAQVVHDGVRNIDATAIGMFVDQLSNSSTPNALVQSRRDAERLFDQSQTAFAAFESGAAVAAQIDLGSFDTHDDHDARHYPKLMDYFAAVDNIIQDAIDRGLGNNLIVVMGSDFARTNRYNNDNGKDHWAHGSMMVWGAPAFINGNRVVGATDDEQRSINLNPNTLATDPNGSLELTMEYVHQALRRVAGVDQSSNASEFPFAEQVLPIFA
ncbi:MAG: DUF1501 domain-containing protein [Pseudomonadota bacterium]